MKKNASIPVKSYLHKFINKKYQEDFNSDGVLHLKKRVIAFKLDDRKSHLVYLAKVDDDYKELELVTLTPRSDYLYAFVACMQKKFVDKMCDYIDVRYGIIDVSQSIRNYLASYNIYESEYSFETAYKNWQRSCEYASIKQNNRCQA